MPASNRTGTPPWFAVALGLASLLWAAGIHHGLGAAPGGIADDWWEPTGFLREAGWATPLFDAPRLGIGLFTLLPALATIGLYVRPAPAFARAMAAVGTTTTAILTFYGLVSTAFSVWTFFHWRGSVVMIASGVLLGCSVAAPDLARALRRCPPLLGALLYGVVFIAVSGLIRNATGWDPKLAFNISPWPAIPVLALEIGVYAWVGALAGMGVAAGSMAFGRTPQSRALGLAVGVALPVLWFAARFPHTDGSQFFVLAICAASLVALAVLATRGGHAALVERAVALGLGAVLVALPLISGRTLADGDFAVSKHIRARVITDALASYYDDEGIYPEELEELVDLGLLDALPVPRVGTGTWRRLGLTGPLAFDYRNLGSSYVLEFVATEWIMCSYNPPWEQEWDEGEDDFEDDGLDADAYYSNCLEVCHVSCDDEDDDCDAYCGGACDAERLEQAARAAASADDAGGEAWSCPDSRPELW